MPTDRLGNNFLWAMRIAWALGPPTGGWLISDALASKSSPLENTALVGLWVLWGLGLISMLWPHSLSLTMLRIIVPLGLPAYIWACVENGGLQESLIALTQICLVFLLAFSAAVGNIFISTETERRFLLKVPVLIQYVLVPVIWGGSMAGLIAAPLLLASHKWLVGGIALPFGVAIFAFGARSLHSLIRRQVILLPNGIVFIDPLRLKLPLRLETSQLQNFTIKKNISNASLAALDLALGTTGPILEIDINPPAQVVPLRRTGSAGPARFLCSRVSFAPTLIGAAYQAIQK